MSSGTVARIVTHHPAPLRFFGFLFLISMPFWLLGTLVGVELLPGLPVSAIMAICPAVAGGFLVWRAAGSQALRSYLALAADYQGLQPWVWFVAVATMPIVMGLSAIVLVSFGAVLPAPQINLIQTLILFAVFFAAATTEELGWTGYATRALVERHGMVAAGLILGAVSVVWHLIPLLQVHRSWDWIAWWAVGTVARRVIIVWLFVRGGQRVFSASLFHAMSNLSWILFPVMGSHYDPAPTAVVLIAFVTVVVRSTGNTREFA